MGILHAETARRYGVPIVWDALDFWRQPGDNLMSDVVARQFLAANIKVIQPALTIGATKAMADDSWGQYLPHHSWAGLVPTWPREAVETVAYEGNALYLGAWHDRLEEACQARGWRFVVNPPDLSKVDILVALRHGQWDGWMPRQWKSGVKVSNAIAAGRPLITQKTAAADESGVEAIWTITDGDDLLKAFDQLSDQSVREDVARACDKAASRFTLETIAAQYRTILAGVPCTA